MLKHMAICGTARTPILTSLRTFGPRAFESLLARPEARVWIGEAGGTIVGFLSMIVGSVDPIERRPGGAEIPPHLHYWASTADGPGPLSTRRSD